MGEGSKYHDLKLLGTAIYSLFFFVWFIKVHEIKKYKIDFKSDKNEITFRK